MELCSYNHDEVVHEDSKCPLCAALDRLAELETASEEAIKTLGRTVDDTVEDLQALIDEALKDLE